MWQPWHALANNSSPVVSVNRKPVLRDGGRERVTSSACAAKDTRQIKAAIAAEKRPVNIAAFRLAGLLGFGRIASHPDDTFMQPRDGIERRKYRAFLPGRNIGRVLAS
jgi:hypothetical protein